MGLILYCNHPCKCKLFKIYLNKLSQEEKSKDINIKMKKCYLLNLEMRMNYHNHLILQMKKRKFKMYHPKDRMKEC